MRDVSECLTRLSGCDVEWAGLTLMYCDTHTHTKGASIYYINRYKGAFVLTQNTFLVNPKHGNEKEDMPTK